MKRYILLIAVAILAGSGISASAQKPLKNIPKRNDAYRPEMVASPVISETMASTFQTKKYGQSLDPSFAKTYWDVYSDRDDNVTYAAPKQKDEYATLSFREKVRIAAVRNNFALVYTIPEGDGTYPYLPVDVQWKGWVPMDNLILWDKALCGDNGECVRYLMGNAIQQSSAMDNIGKLYTHPNSPKSFVRLPSVSKSIFYCLKREGNMLLLALDKEIGNNPENIYGWVDERSMLVWRSRVCLEPSWEVEDVQSFAGTGVVSEIYADGSFMTKLGSVPYTAFEMPAYKTEAYRTMGSQWRYPLIGRAGYGHLVYAMPVDSPFLDINASESVSDEDELGKDLNTVNIVFVLDGSRAYEEYYPLIAEKFKVLRSELALYPVRVAIQFYRDVRNEDFATEYKGMYDTRNRDLETFLQDGGQYGYRDNTSDPALLKGIADALDKADFRPSETNVLIVVGGRGDSSDAKALPKNLADRLDATNVTLYGIQLQNNPSSAGYGLFNYQLSDMIYSKLAARAAKTGSELDAVVQYTRETDGVNKVVFALNDPASAYFENHLYPVEGKLDEDVFVDHLKEIYGEIGRSIKQKKQELASGEGGLSQLFTIVHAGSADRTNRQFYKMVAAYDEDEFKQMITDFAPFYEMDLTAMNPLNGIVQNLTTLLSKIPENVEIKPDDRGCYEILRLYEGVDDIPYKGAKLKEIREGKNYTPEQGMRFLDDFAMKYRKLLEIQKNPYPNSRQINGKLYYFIPVEYLP